MNLNGKYKSKNSWRCKCCNFPVRQTPQGGRKSLRLNKAIILGEIPDAPEN